MGNVNEIVLSCKPEYRLPKVHYHLKITNA